MSAPDPSLLSINTATVRAQWPLPDIISALARHGIRGISPWRDQVAAAGLDDTARRIRDAGLTVTGLCRGGMFPAPDREGRRAAHDDNRRAVDYDVRRTQLAQLTALAADVQPSKLNALFASPYDGLAKLWVIWRGLGLRRTYPALFARGDYRPVSITGARKEHLVAFARTHEKETIVVVAGRLFASLNIDVGALPVGDAWGDTTLDLAFMGARDGIDVLSGQAVAVARERVPASMICRTFPCALLHFPNTSGSRRTATK